MLRRFLQRFAVKSRFARGILKHCRHGFGGGLGGAARKRGKGTVHNIHPGKRRGKIDRFAGAAGVMRVQMNRQADFFFHFGNEGKRRAGE